MKILVASGPSSSSPSWPSGCVFRLGSARLGWLALWLARAVWKEEETIAGLEVAHVSVAANECASPIERDEKVFKRKSGSPKIGANNSDEVNSNSNSSGQAKSNRCGRCS